MNRTIDKCCRGLWLLAAVSLLGGCAAYRKCGFLGCPGDVEISAAVRRQLAQHPGVGVDTAFSVQTLDGVVYLGGTVDTDLQKDEAEEMVKLVPGVKRLVSTINPRNGPY